MDKTKQTLAIALVAVLAVVAGGWFLLVSPQRSNVTSLNDQTSTQENTNASLQSKITALKAELVELPAAKAQLEAVARRLPPDLAEVGLIQSLTKAAADANVDLQVITPGAPVAVGAPAAAVPTTSAPAAGATTSAAPAAGTTTSAATLPAAAPAPAAGNLYSVPLALTVSGDYFDLEMFVHNLEGMQRALLVSSLTITKNPVSVVAVTTAGAAATTTAATVKSTSKSTGKTSTSGKVTSKTGSKTKPVAGSAAAAQQAADKEPQFAVDQNTLTVTLAAQVFSLYTTTPAAALVPTAAPTSAPTK
jgi:Tfp pilus assembly protein PilO